jgi:hypothetical protein
MMNKNIKEIAAQAWVFANNQYDVPKPQIMRFQEKFAEMILEECLTVVKNNISGPAGKYDYSYTDENCAADTRAQTIYDEIKAHFGVIE